MTFDNVESILYLFNNSQFTLSNEERKENVCVCVKILREINLSVEGNEEEQTKPVLCV